MGAGFAVGPELRCEAANALGAVAVARAITAPSGNSAVRHLEAMGPVLLFDRGRPDHRGLGGFPLTARASDIFATGAGTQLIHPSAVTWPRLLRQRGDC